MLRRSAHTHSLDLTDRDQSPFMIATRGFCHLTRQQSPAECINRIPVLKEHWAISYIVSKYLDIYDSHIRNVRAI